MRVERELMRGAGPAAVLRLLEGGERYGYELVKLLDRSSDGVLARLLDTDDSERNDMSVAARTHVLENHTAMHRAIEFETAIRAAQRTARRSLKKPATV